MAKKKRPPGRPGTPESKQRKHRVVAYLTEQDWKRVVEAAGDQGVSIWARARLLEALG